MCVQLHWRRGSGNRSAWLDGRRMEWARVCIELSLIRPSLHFRDERTKPTNMHTHSHRQQTTESHAENQSRTFVFLESVGDGHGSGGGGWLKFSLRIARAFQLALSRCGKHTRECVSWNGRKFDGNDDDSKRVSDETLRGWENCIFNTIQLRHSQNCMKIRAARNKFYIYIHLRLKSNCIILNSESFTIRNSVDDIERTEHRI